MIMPHEVLSSQIKQAAQATHARAHAQTQAQTYLVSIQRLLGAKGPRKGDEVKVQRAVAAGTDWTVLLLNTNELLITALTITQPRGINVGSDISDAKLVELVVIARLQLPDSVMALSATCIDTPDGSPQRRKSPSAAPTTKTQIIVGFVLWSNPLVVALYRLQRDPTNAAIPTTFDLVSEVWRFPLLPSHHLVLALCR